MSGMREVIFSLNSPVLFQGKISEWEMLKWTENDWSRLFGDKSLPFRCGLRKCMPAPQWERNCETRHMTLDDFFESGRDGTSDSWKYFDYKYVNQWLTDPEAFKSLSWACFGFPEITPNDCTLWIGSSGSHTPCHMDTYGCNLVAQLYGHKQWILFPPSEGSKLKISRVPYEESSIYSALNFNGPLGEICNSLDSAYVVTLAPGDVLVVPRHWWHYVENVDTAVSLNTWIPLPSDDDSRMAEVLVRFFVSQVISNLPSEQALSVLNPNEDALSDVSLETTMSQIDLCIENCLEASKKCRQVEKNVVETATCVESPDHKMLKAKDNDAICSSPDRKRKKIDSVSHRCDYDSSSLENSNFKVLGKCSSTELRKVLDAKCKCESSEKHAEAVKPHQLLGGAMKLLPAVINAFSHPEVIETVTKHLLRQISTGHI